MLHRSTSREDRDDIENKRHGRRISVPMSLRPDFEVDLTLAEQRGRQCLEGTNKLRLERSLPPLVWDHEVFAIAQRHAQDMANGIAPFSHDKVVDRLVEAGVRSKHAGGAENLALVNRVDAAVERWAFSEMHAANILGNYGLCAVGVAETTGGWLYMTQILIRPRAVVQEVTV